MLWHCWFGHLACKNRPRNDQLCVEWDVKPYTLTHSRTSWSSTAAWKRPMKLWFRCEIKLFRHDFEIISVFCFTCKTTSETEIKLFQLRKLFQNYFSNIEHVGKYSWVGMRFWDNFEIILFYMQPRHYNKILEFLIKNSVCVGEVGIPTPWEKHIFARTAANVLAKYCIFYYIWF